MATRTGWRPGSTYTPVPTLSLAVRDSAYAIPMNGSTSGPYTISGSHSESTPDFSSSSTAAANPPGTPAEPSAIPIRTFTRPSHHGPLGPVSSGEPFWLPVQAWWIVSIVEAGMRAPGEAYGVRESAGNRSGGATVSRETEPVLSGMSGSNR